LLLDRLQVWQRASALVLEAQQTPPALLQLVYSLQQALLPLGVEAADREYRPHLTLARDYRGQPPEASSAPDFYLAARHFTLYESRKGAYWPLAQWPLSG
jgi:2'-5' RNA ligase